ncbi:class I SAM-dependent methyltransferase [Hyphomonas johnsonii]|uniref:Putative methyltransferase n=1 Tax=Hyphomonas johnsonii MHS-2 TaxID=1280950 RepID=A0A059FSS6_9PROT|nr:class I SAM-dependent methyltransferase [Hyphomonas johnsonii]KCZ93750.1 putative methyltransferase [Hyphomonas johnsonii MHS-2]
MDTDVLDTLMLALDGGGVTVPETGDILFLRAEPGPVLSLLPTARLTCQQTFKPPHDALKAAGHTLLAPGSEQFGPAALTLILPPRQKDEARGLYARAMLAAPEGATVLACLPNTLGAKTAEKTLGEIAGETQSLSKNKCRAFWARKDSARFNKALAEAWVAADQPQPVADGEMWSRPGLFSWDRVDAGSELLAESVPEDIKGAGADFGAGQGYLTKAVLAHCPRITHMDLYEAEHRAIACAEKTLEGIDNVAIHWADVTRDPQESRYDFILMNPPFHVGRADAAGLGQAFIQAAARALKPGGALYMVANRHLPYEATVKACFKQYEILEDSGGYKVIRADRPKRQK